jgi:hypothetical protein
MKIVQVELFVAFFSSLFFITPSVTRSAKLTSRQLAGEVEAVPEEEASSSFSSPLSSLSSFANEATTQISRVAHSWSFSKLTTPTIAPSVTVPLATVPTTVASAQTHPLVPTSVPPVDFDSDEEDFVPHTMSQTPGVASVEQANAKLPPSLTSGTISPEILYQWERAALNFFRVKSIPAAERVINVIYELKDPRMAA